MLDYRDALAHVLRDARQNFDPDDPPGDEEVLEFVLDSLTIAGLIAYPDGSHRYYQRVLAEHHNPTRGELLELLEEATQELPDLAEHQQVWLARLETGKLA